MHNTPHSAESRALISAHKMKHGMARTPTYKAWKGMKHRCFNPKSSDYPRYGGMGITVCARWLTFENFYADMGDRPAGLTLDRIAGGTSNYEPGNCRWATRSEQAINRRERQRDAKGQYA